MAKRKPPRKPRPTKRKKRAAPKSKAPPVSPFTRAKIARPFARQRSDTATAASYQKWARGKGGVDDLTESRRSQVRKLLERRYVYPEVIEKICAMDPERYYIVEIYGYKGSGRDDGDAAPGDEPVKQATFVGNGAELWSRCVGYASKAPIEHVEIHELARPVQDHPLWDTPHSIYGVESVQILTGERFYGHGGLEEWKDRKKNGRPKKPGGGMSADERRKDRKKKTDAKKRRDEMRKRYEKLKKTDPVAAERMKRRAERARKIDL